MEKCNATTSIRRNISCGDLQTKYLEQDINQAIKRHGAYDVRCAAVQQLSGKNDQALAEVGLADYTNFYDRIDISNTAFAQMTPEEVHREFCADRKMEFWWPTGV